MPDPLAYLVTFSCYGTNLPGQPEASVDKRNNRYGEEYAPEAPGLCGYAASRMAGRSFTLDQEGRSHCREAIVGFCNSRNISLVALHVRTTHVHLVAATCLPADRVLNGLKAACSRKLNRVSGAARRHWTRGGSKRWLWRPDQLVAAVDYVLRQQGEPMETYFDGEALCVLMR